MADAVIFGTETGLCPDPDDAGCIHAVGVHDAVAGGCSHIGSSGWCDCTWVPERTGAAKLLADSVGKRYTVSTVRAASAKAGPTLPAGSGLVGLIPASTTFSATGPINGNSLKCKALVRVSKDAFRPCKKPGEFQKWVPIPGFGQPSSWIQKLETVCFSHNKTMVVFFES